MPVAFFRVFLGLPEGEALFGSRRRLFDKLKNWNEGPLSGSLTLYPPSNPP
jgi:hypothetical protein